VKSLTFHAALETLACIYLDGNPWRKQKFHTLSKQDEFLGTIKSETRKIHLWNAKFDIADDVPISGIYNVMNVGSRKLEVVCETKLYIYWTSEPNDGDIVVMDTFSVIIKPIDIIDLTHATVVYATDKRY
jgi:hypothetical protein